MTTVYIIYRATRDRYYVGCTDDLTRRLTEHNSGQTKSTRGGDPWELVFSREFTDRAAGLSFERKIKNQKSRHFIEELINTG